MAKKPRAQGRALGWEGATAWYRPGNRAERQVLEKLARLGGVRRARDSREGTVYGTPYVRCVLKPLDRLGERCRICALQGIETPATHRAEEAPQDPAQPEERGGALYICDGCWKQFARAAPPGLREP